MRERELEMLWRMDRCRFMVLEVLVVDYDKGNCLGVMMFFYNYTHITMKKYHV